jgi:DNA integrity scanning protein DisA with diadenylate cyclase activity
LTAIGVLIVFRYEIRSLFQTKEVRDILWRVSTKPVITPVEIIANSVYHLARKRIGALIVLARAPTGRCGHSKQCDLARQSFTRNDRKHLLAGQSRP